MDANEQFRVEIMARVSGKFAFEIWKEDELVDYSRFVYGSREAAEKAAKPIVERLVRLYTEIV